MRLLAVVFLVLVGSGCAARMSQTELRAQGHESDLEGRWVEVHASDGKVLEGRVVEIQFNADTSLVLRQQDGIQEEARIRYAAIDEIRWRDYKRTVFALGAIGVGVYVALVFLFSANWY